MKNKVYLAYGSNLNTEQMAWRCPSAKQIGTAVLNDYQLLFRGRREGAVANIEPLKGASVPVLLWTITPDDERELDAYEGWPILYRKERLTIQLNGKPVAAMVYVMNEGKPLGTPAPYYYSIIREGYKACGFDDAILKKAAADSAENEVFHG